MKYCSHCGKELTKKAATCPYCGYSVETDPLDVSNIKLNILALLLPLIGFYWYSVYYDETPNKANTLGKFALAGLYIWYICILGILIAFFS